MERSEVRFGNARIAYAVERTRRRKTVAVAVDERGQVALRAPVDTPIERLDRIVHHKARWILARQQRRLREAPPAPARGFVSGESFRYLGRQYRLAVRPAAGAEQRVRLDRGWLVAAVDPALHARPGEDPARAAQVRALLIGWYRGHAGKHLTARVAARAPALGVTPAAVLVREQRKRWGSCDARGVLRLNWRVIQAPPRLQDYVVVHELAHLVERDHTRGFWALVGQVLPDYEARRAALLALGPQLVW